MLITKISHSRNLTFELFHILGVPNSLTWYQNKDREDREERKREREKREGDKARLRRRSHSDR